MNNKENWIVGISDSKPHEYKIGNVTFEVYSEFEPSKSEMTIRNRFERTVTNDFIDLTSHIKDIKIGSDMCVRLPERRANAAEEEK